MEIEKFEQMKSTHLESETVLLSLGNNVSLVKSSAFHITVYKDSLDFRY